MEFLGKKENVQPKAKDDISKTMKLMEKLDRDYADEQSDSEPLSPYTSWLPRYNEDTEEDVVDLPQQLMDKPGAGKQVQDLQRCSVKIGEDLRRAGAGRTEGGVLAPLQQSGTGQDRGSRAQGELYVKSGFIFKSWRRRYGSIVEHSYFGPVLFLFKYNVHGNIESKHSDMIALAEAQVCVGKNRKAGDGFRCEFFLKTAKKRYNLATNDSTRRDFWMQHM